MTIRIRSANVPALCSALAVVALSLVACKGTSTLAPSAARRPSIAVPEPRHDVGVVTEGDPVKHVFALRNVGDDLLTIRRAQGS